MGLRSLTIGALCLASSVVARTDIAGCTYFDTVSAYPGGQAFATRIWYVPDTGELCELLDCGGGRAPPKTMVPGCAAYKGTDTYSPRFINPKTLGHAPATATQGPATTTADSPSTLTTAASVTSAPSAATTTGAPVTTKAPETTETGSNTAKVTATPSGSASSGAPGTNSTKPVSTTASTAAAAGLPTAGAMLGSLMVAGVAAGLGIF